MPGSGTPRRKPSRRGPVHGRDTRRRRAGSRRSASGRGRRRPTRGSSTRRACGSLPSTARGPARRRPSFEGLDLELDRLELLLRELAECGTRIPHRTRGIELQLSFARRILDAHREWVDEVRRGGDGRRAGFGQVTGRSHRAASGRRSRRSAWSSARPASFRVSRPKAPRTIQRRTSRPARRRRSETSGARLGAR